MSKMINPMWLIIALLLVVSALNVRSAPAVDSTKSLAMPSGWGESSPPFAIGAYQRKPTTPTTKPRKQRSHKHAPKTDTGVGPQFFMSVGWGPSGK